MPRGIADRSAPSTLHRPRRRELGEPDWEVGACQWRRPSPGRRVSHVTANLRRAMGRVSRARCLQLAVACWVVMAYVAFSRFIAPTSAPVTASSRARTHRDDHRDAQLRATARQRAEPPRRARLQAAMSELQSRLRAFDGTTSPALTTAVTPASASAATAAPDDGMELDPRTSLLLPRFWQPPPGIDLDAQVEKVNGRPTILVMIASYRDFQCAETVSNALLRAKYPRRLSFAIVQQNGPDDASCDVPELPCETAPEQPLCVYKRSVHTYTMDASKGTGPVYARHVGARMYRGEAFVLQAHRRRRRRRRRHHPDHYHHHHQHQRRPCRADRRARAVCRRLGRRHPPAVARDAQ